MHTSLHDLVGCDAVFGDSSDSEEDVEVDVVREPVAPVVDGDSFVDQLDGRPGGAPGKILPYPSPYPCPCPCPSRFPLRPCLVTWRCVETKMIDYYLSASLHPLPVRLVLSSHP